MDLLDGLNPEQIAAVMHDAGPALVVAGAGTGKTQVITRRIAYLIGEHKAKPREILALTFTEKAAREMQQRLYEMIGWESFQVPVMTFHAFGAELLSRYATHIGRSIRGGLINDTQKTLLLQQHIGRIDLAYYGSQQNQYEFLEGIISYIGQLQNAGVATRTVLRARRDLGEERFYRSFILNNLPNLSACVNERCSSRCSFERKRTLGPRNDRLDIMSHFLRFRFGRLNAFMQQERGRKAGERCCSMARRAI